LKPTITVISVGKGLHAHVDPGYHSFGKFQHVTALDGDFSVSFDSVFAGKVV
jgi:hypothetical protein